MTFKKGQSGNPGGRPKLITEFRQACQEEWRSVFETWKQIMNNEGADQFARIAAAKEIAAYGFGKPSQAVAIEDPDGAVHTLADVIRRGITGKDDE